MSRPLGSGTHEWVNGPMPLIPVPPRCRIGVCGDEGVRAGIVSTAETLRTRRVRCFFCRPGNCGRQKGRSPRDARDGVSWRFLRALCVSAVNGVVRSIRNAYHMRSSSGIGMRHGSAAVDTTNCFSYGQRTKGEGGHWGQWVDGRVCHLRGLAALARCESCA